MRPQSQVAARPAAVASGGTDPILGAFDAVEMEWAPMGGVCTHLLESERERVRVCVCVCR